MATNIKLPHRYTPRNYQVGLFRALDSGIKRLIAVWHRRCLSGETHVIMGNGHWKRIKDIEKGDIVLSWNGSEYCTDKVVNKWNAGKKPVYRVKAKGFKDIYPTKDHRFYIGRQGNSRSWKCLEDISVFEKLNTYPSVKNSSDTKNNELAELIGYLVTDGSVNEEQSPKFTNTNIDICRRVEYLVKSCFGYDAKWHKKGNGYDLILSNGTNGGGKTPNKIKEFFRKEGALHKKNKRRIPEMMFNCGRESVLAFFGAVISGDGSIYTQATGRYIEGKYINPSSEIKISVGESEDLMWDYYWLLRKIGIPAGQAKKDIRENHNCFEIRIWTKEFINKFLSLIKTIGKEEARIEAIENTRGYKERKIIDGNYEAGFKCDYDDFIETETYDIETEKHHCFVADGYIVHNSGKDKTMINLVANQLPQRVGAYYYYFPTAALGRKVLWDGRDKNGMKFLDHFPKAMIRKKNENEMKIEFVDGSTFQILGTDRLDVVGVNPVGVIFSEYAQQDPRVWDFVRPILVENEGWAAFNGTPRGKNHFHKLYNRALLNPERWYVSLLTVEDTGVIPLGEIDKEREDGMSEEMIRQEFYCDFDYGLEGSYYALLVHQMTQEKRIGVYPHIPALPVMTSWDIGVGDSNAIWFLQQDGMYINAIDYYEMSNVGVDHYARHLHRKELEEGYVYSSHYAPHDINVREWGAEHAAKRIETARNLGINFTKIPKVANKMDGIDSVRNLFPILRIDKTKCKRGIEALQDFQKQWNDKYQVYSDKPLRNWAKHGADALETFAVARQIHGINTGRSMTQEQIAGLEKEYLYDGAI